MEKEFFMVWSERSRETRVRHQDEYAAKAAAVRWARENPGCKFYVLRAEGYAEQPQQPNIYHPLESEIPF